MFRAVPMIWKVNRYLVALRPARGEQLLLTAFGWLQASLILVLG